MTEETFDADLELEGLANVESEDDNDGDIKGTGETETTGDTDAEAAAKAKADETAAAEAAAKKEAEAKALYDRFTGAIEEALTNEGYDSATGTIPAIGLSPISKAYLEMNAKTRKAAKQYTLEKMQDCLAEGDFQLSRSYMQISKALTEAKPEQIVKPPVDPTEDFVVAVTAQRLAGNFMAAPAGVAEDWADRVKNLGSEIMTPGEDGLNQIQRYINWMTENEGKEGDDRTAEPDVHEAVKRAAQLAKGRGPRTPRAKSGESKPRERKASTGGDGTKRNVGEHIREAFEGVAVGEFLTVAQIAAFASKEYEGTDGPSAGAINARLFPASGKGTTLTFVRGEGTAEGRPQKGAVKIA